jgi:hypothetical protein
MIYQRVSSAERYFVTSRLKELKNISTLLSIFFVRDDYRMNARK